MSELTRISISLETALLEAFDRDLTARGYATRSEAIRDLIRDRLIREETEKDDGEQVAVVTLVYDHHARELAARLIDMQHHHHRLVVSSMHVHLGERHCLEVSVLRGRGKEVRHLGEELLATKGVLHGEIALTSDEESLSRWGGVAGEDHDHPHHHPHPHPHD
jgi:CopG family nickel-responsive transcriptional regulator